MDVDTINLYGRVSSPVPRGTPSVSSLVRWDHSATFDVPTEKDFDLKAGRGSCVSYDVSLEDIEENENKYVSGHKIDGRILYPATGTYIVIGVLQAAFGLLHHNHSPIMLQIIITIHQSYCRVSRACLENSGIPTEPRLPANASHL